MLKPYLSLFKVGQPALHARGAGHRQGDARGGRRYFPRPEMARHSADGGERGEVGRGARRQIRDRPRRAAGFEMLQAAQEAVKGSRTEILAVTVLTSLDDGALRQIGFERTCGGSGCAAGAARGAGGVSGLVCSPHEIELIRQQVPEPVKLVTPGVRSGSGRPAGPEADALRTPRRSSAARIISSSAGPSRRHPIPSPRRRLSWPSAGVELGHEERCVLRAFWMVIARSSILAIARCHSPPTPPRSGRS